MENKEKFNGFNKYYHTIPSEFSMGNMIKEFNLGACDIAVFLMINWMTHGFQRSEAYITLDFFVKRSGFSIRNVDRSLKKLKELNLIEIIKKSNKLYYRVKYNEKSKSERLDSYSKMESIDFLCEKKTHMDTHVHPRTANMDTHDIETIVNIDTHDQDTHDQLDTDDQSDWTCMTNSLDTGVHQDNIILDNIRIDNIISYAENDTDVHDTDVQDDTDDHKQSLPNQSFSFVSPCGSAKVADSQPATDKQSHKSSNSFNLLEYIEKMKKDKRKHIQIIAWLIEHQKPEITSLEQLKAYISRHSKSAQTLTAFEDWKIQGVMDLLDEKCKKWEDPHYTLETVVKYIFDFNAGKNPETNIQSSTSQTQITNQTPQPSGNPQKKIEFYAKEDWVKRMAQLKWIEKYPEAAMAFHQLKQMVLDTLRANPEKYAGGKGQEYANKEMDKFKEKYAIEWAYYKKIQEDIKREQEKYKDMSILPPWEQREFVAKKLRELAEKHSVVKVLGLEEGGKR